MNPTSKFSEGCTFPSFESLKTAVRELGVYQNAVFVLRSSVKTMHQETAELQYESVIYECKHGSRRKSCSQGVRPNQRSLKLGCQAKLTLKAKKINGLWQLVVSKSCLNHNAHVPTLESVSLLPERRRPMMTTEVKTLLRCPSVTVADIRDTVLRQQNVYLLPQDVHNMRAKQKSTFEQEQYNSLSQQKQLDEEMEMEIYNLISTHKDKQLARMMIRDKLTNETGRAMSIEDILNIEKKVNRKLELEKRFEGGGNNDSDTRESEEVKEEADVESEEVKEDAGVESEESNAEPLEKTEPKETPLFVHQRSSSETQLIQELPAAGCPQGNGREPHHFDDAVENDIKILHTSKDSVVPLISPDEASSLDSSSPVSDSRKQAVKDEEETVPSRKKRKVQGTTDHLNVESIQERKLAIKEELLELERKKVMILQDIVKKLDQIIENQERR